MYLQTRRKWQWCKQGDLDLHVFTVVDSAGSKYLQNRFLWLNQISIVIETLYFANLTQENIVGKGLV
jgi:primase-polymerase (primpol)-like protein